MVSIKKNESLIILIMWVMLMAILYSNLNISLFLIVSFIASFVYFIIVFKKIKFKKYYLLIFSFVIYYITITIFNAENVIGVVLRYVCMPFFIYVLLPKTRIGRQRLLGYLKLFIGLSAIYGIFEYFLHFNIMVYFVKIESVKWIEYMNDSTSYYISSIFLHYTYFAYILLIGLIISLVFPYRNKIYNIIYNSLIIIDILLTQSRIIWIATIIFLTIFFLRNNKDKTKSITRIIILILGIIFFLLFGSYLHIFETFGDFISNRFDSLFKYGLSNGSLGQRFGTLSNFNSYLDDSTLQAIFGSGYGGVSTYLVKYSFFTGYSTVDSMLTVFLVEVGLLGTVLFILAIIQVINRILKFNNYYSILALYTLIGTLITFLTLDFYSNYVVLYLFYVVILLSVDGMEEDECSKTILY